MELANKKVTTMSELVIYLQELLQKTGNQYLERPLLISGSQDVVSRIVALAIEADDSQ